MATFIQPILDQALIPRKFPNAQDEAIYCVHALVYYGIDVGEKIPIEMWKLYE